MNCSNYREQISQFLDHELDQPSESDLFSHLGTCNSCRECMKDFLVLRSDLNRIETPSFPSKLDTRIQNSFSLTNRPASTFQPRMMGFMKEPRYSFLSVGLAVLLAIISSTMLSTWRYRTMPPKETYVCLTPLPEVEVNGYVIVASSPIKGINQ